MGRIQRSGRYDLILIGFLPIPPFPKNEGATLRVQVLAIKLLLMMLVLLFVCLHPHPIFRCTLLTSV
jgi:hypothetical protein